MGESTQKIKHHVSQLSQQRKNLMLVFSVVIVVVIILHKLMSDSKPSVITHQAQTKGLASSGKSVDPKEYWLEIAESRLEEQEKKLDKIQKMLEKSINNTTAKTDLNEDKINALVETKIEEIIKQHEASESAEPYQQIELPELPELATNTRYLEPQPSSYYSANNQMPVAFEESGILSIDVDLIEQVNANTKTVENYLPVGSFVKAVLLGGADVSAALSASTNPQPILFRLVKEGSLPGDYSSILKECRVMGAAYGDISSERAYVRLEKISCVRDDESIFESPVQGYAAGEDGKTGLRGRVVWREGAMIQRSFISGFAGGVGNGVSESFGTFSTSPLGSVITYNPADIIQQGFAQGFGTSLERLSEYYIDRAEQYQPVIEIEAGRSVDLVINGNGLYLDDVVRGKRR